MSKQDVNHTIRLGDKQIEALINGESIIVKLPNDEFVVIEQALIKDIAAPILNRDKKIFSKNEIENIKRSTRMMADMFKSNGI